MSNFVNLMDIVYPVHSMHITTSSISLQHLLAVLGHRLQMVPVLRHIRTLLVILVVKQLVLAKCLNIIIH